MYSLRNWDDFKISIWRLLDTKLSLFPNTICEYNKLDLQYRSTESLLYFANFKTYLSFALEKIKIDAIQMQRVIFL